MNLVFDPHEFHRSRIYAGEVHLLRSTPCSAALCSRVWTEIVKSLDDSDPRTIRRRLDNPTFFERFAVPRRGVGLDPDILQLTRQLLRELGYPAHTLFDRPRIRSVQSGGHHIPEASPAYGLHRDTWYANPQAQINHWLPLHDTTPEEVFGFFPEFWSRPIANTSACFDYDDWNRTGGFQAYQHARPSEQIHPSTPPLDSSRAVRIAAPAAYILRFSAAHLHGTLPHDSGFTRYSLEIRTVDPEDHAAGIGAPNLDNASRGNMTPDLLRLGDG